MDIKTHIYAPYKIHFRSHHRLKAKGWKKVVLVNVTKKKTRVAMLISDKIDFKTKAVTRDHERH